MRIQVTPEGYMRTMLEKKITDTAKMMADLPETQELQRLTRQCEVLLEAIDEDLYVSSSDEDEATYNNDLYSSDDSSEEAVSWRKKREVYFAKKYEKESLKQLTESFQPNSSTMSSITKSSKNKSTLATEDDHVNNSSALDDLQLVYQSVNKRVIQPIYNHLSTYTSKRIKKSQKYAKDFVELQYLKLYKIYNQFIGSFDELQRELKVELSRQYVEHQVVLAREKARREFGVIEKGR
jgi:hypothetical protein